MMVDNFTAWNAAYWTCPEGCFTDQPPEHPHYVDGKYAELSSQLLEGDAAAGTGRIQAESRSEENIAAWYLEFTHFISPTSGR